MKKRRKDFPRLRDFLEYAQRVSPLNQADRRLAAVMLGGGLGSLVLGGVLGALFLGTWLGFATFVVGIVATILATTRLYQSHYRPADERARRRAETFSHTRTLLGFIRQRKLHRHMEMSAAEMLEVCAHHWLRVNRGLEAQGWSEATDGPWSALRHQIQAAADEAMLEAIFLTRNYVAMKPTQTGREWLEWLEDIIDVDVEKALRRVGLVSHRSEKVDTTFLSPVHSILDKLQTLGDEVEKTRISAEPGTLGVAPAIDLAVSELQAIRRAERELRDDLQVRIGDEP